MKGLFERATRAKYRIKGAARQREPCSPQHLSAAFYRQEYAMTDVLILTPAPDEPRFANSWSPLFERLAAPLRAEG
jgi:hypothetical protein